MNSKAKKSLAVFLSALMLISFMPLFASAASIKLTRTNIEIVAPSVSPSEISYGQTLGELTITGGEMWYVDGTGAKILVPGYFTVYNTTIAPAASESYEVYLKFVPTDENYTCTATFRSSNSTFTGTWPTIKVKAPEIVAEASLAEAPVVALPIVGGELLTRASLSGGKVVDVDGNDVTASGKWAWVDQSAVVTESATYTAKWTATNNDYKSVTAEVFVTVKTPTCFVDEVGNAITPEIRIPFNSAISSDHLKQYIEKFTANCGEFIIGMIPTIDTSELGEYEYSVRIVPNSNYYTIEMLTFKAIIEPKEITPTFSIFGNDEYEIRVSDYTINPKGTFDFYVDDELVIEGIEYGKRFTWRPEKSGTYDLKAVYNPIENDTYKVNDVIREDLEKNLTWKINCINCGAYDYRYGETASVNHSLGDQFGGWKFYDENGNEFTPENLDTDTSSWVYFTMPDFAITVEAVDKSASSGSDGTLGDVDNIFGDLGECSIFANLVAKIKQFFNAIVVFLTAAFAFSM